MEFIKFILVSILIREGVEAKQNAKIQMGIGTDIREVPFVGSYRVEEEGAKKMVCTVNLISLITALTAGHCLIENILSEPIQFFSIKKYRPYVIMGVSNRTNKVDPLYQLRWVENYFIHPRARYITFYPFESRYDVGAVRWKTPVQLSATVQLAPLPPEEDTLSVMAEITKEMGNCRVVGWGALEVTYEEPIPYPDMLQSARFSVLTKDNCCTLYFNWTKDDCMDRLGLGSSTSIGYNCYERYTPGTSTANGDSGSPLLCPFKGNRTVVGIIISGFQRYDILPSGEVVVMRPGLFVESNVLYSMIKSIPGPTSNAHKKTTAIYPSLIIAAKFLLL